MSRKKARLVSDSARANSPPVLKLEDVKLIVNGADNEINYFHLFGIFVYEESDSVGSYWYLSDETCLGGLKIKLCRSNQEQYPVTKPGDIVRIHRASLDRRDYTKNLPFVATSKNVVVWSAFEHDPIPRTTAKSPTITDEDRERQRTLETFYCSQITDVSCIKRDTQAVTKFFNIAGVVEKIDKDTFGHLRITFRDATDSFVVRVFRGDQSGRDCNDHFEVASKLEIGQYIVVANTKIDKLGGWLGLSANKSHGKSLRVVGRTSILGTLLTESLNNNLVGTNNNGASIQQLDSSDDSSQQQVKSSQTSTATQAGIPNRPLRRSPRFHNQQTDTDNDISPSVITLDSTSSSASSSQEPQGTQGPQGLQHILPLVSEEYNDPQDPMHKYTKFSEIIERPDREYLFCDIAGQVRGDPGEAGKYGGHWVVQIYDGSRPKSESYYVDNVDLPQPECITLMVFSPKNTGDTNQHIDTAKRLKEGDLILVKNVKVSWWQGKMKLGLSANLEHGKSISKIEKGSRFGRHLTEMVACPFIEELLEAHSYPTPPDNDSSIEHDDTV